MTGRAADSPPPPPPAPAAPPASPPAPTGATAAGAGQDRWAWRRRIKADPHRRRVYRVLVAVVGVSLMVLAVLTGWLPGPGGIPLFLAGLAVLASEFAWAHRLLHRARVDVHRFTRWAAARPWWVRALGTAGCAVVALGAGYLYLLVLGAPTLLPSSWTDALASLPGVDR